MIGVVIALAVATAFSFMNILIRWGVRPGERDNGLRATLIVNVVVFTILLALLTAAGRGVTLSAEGVGAFILAGLFATFLGRYTLFAAIGLIGAARAAAIKNATPLVSVGLAIGFLGEVLSIPSALGMALVMLGLFLLLHEMGMNRGETEQEALVVDAEAGEVHAPGPARPGRRALVLGVATALAAAVAFGTGHAFRKIGIDVLPDPLLGATIGSWVALLTSLGLSALRRELGGFVGVLGSFRRSFWLAGAAGAAGQLCFFSALAFAPLSHVAVVAASETVITVMLAAVLIRKAERVTRMVVLPAILVFGGSALIAIAP